MTYALRCAPRAISAAVAGWPAAEGGRRARREKSRPPPPTNPWPENQKIAKPYVKSTKML
eukprot:5125561-Heterocapsa_arctica.AAC.1